MKYQGRGLNSFEPVTRNNFANEWNIYLNTPKQMMSADVHLFFHEPPCPRLWFYCNLFLLYFAPSCSLSTPFCSILINPTRSWRDENFIERHDHCHVNLIWKEMQTFLERMNISNYLTGVSLWKILSNLLYICIFLKTCLLLRGKEF